MNLEMAKNNWRNFFKQMVGAPKTFDVKIERSAKAQQYPLLAVKKDGDVGYDLPSIEDMVIKAPTLKQRTDYMHYKAKADALRDALNKAGNNVEHIEYERRIEMLDKLALNQLPRTIIPTGIKLEMPNNIWCTISARSSASNQMLITPDSIIDAGYRGEFFAVVFNIGFADVHIKAGDRVCQVIFHERVLANMIEVDKLSPSERGESGFGSTGK